MRQIYVEYERSRLEDHTARDGKMVQWVKEFATKT